MNPVYLDTARMLAQVAPLVFVDDTFALKGGTAINLFVRDMPRDQALARIQGAIREAAARLGRRGFAVHIPDVDAGETKLLVRRDRIEVKVEANFVMRGTVRPVGRASFTAATRDRLLADVEIPVVSLEDMYGGKLNAALDRQHSRDLFDVMQLYSNEGITAGIRHDFTHNFQGMTAEPVSLEALLEVRERMVRQVQKELDDNMRRFLLSLVSGEPEWSLLGIAHLEHLPGMGLTRRRLLGSCHPPGRTPCRPPPVRAGVAHRRSSIRRATHIIGPRPRCCISSWSSTIRISMSCVPGRVDHCPTTCFTGSRPQIIFWIGSAPNRPASFASG